MVLAVRVTSVTNDLESPNHLADGEEANDFRGDNGHGGHGGGIKVP